MSWCKVRADEGKLGEVRVLNFQAYFHGGKAFRVLCVFFLRFVI